MTDKEKIRAEIERRRNIVNNSALQMKDVDKRNHYSEMVEEYDDILRFINSLPEEPVSEDLEKAAEQDVCEVVNCGSAIGIPNDHVPSWVQDAMVSEFIYGALWQKKQMMKNAKDGVITFDYYGDNDKIYGCIAHDSFSLEELGLKDGDKVKMIIIKEDEQ